MLKGLKKRIDNEQGKTKHEAPRSVNYRATQNKDNVGTTALETKTHAATLTSTQNSDHGKFSADRLEVIELESVASRIALSDF